MQFKIPQLHEDKITVRKKIQPQNQNTPQWRSQLQKLAEQKEILDCRSTAPGKIRNRGSIMHQMLILHREKRLAGFSSVI